MLRIRLHEIELSIELQSLFWLVQIVAARVRRRWRFVIGRIDVKVGVVFRSVVVSGVLVESGDVSSAQFAID
jgi:hypothetical protein